MGKGPAGQLLGLGFAARPWTMVRDVWSNVWRGTYAVFAVEILRVIVVDWLDQWPCSAEGEGSIPSH